MSRRSKGKLGKEFFICYREKPLAALEHLPGFNRPKGPFTAKDSYPSLSTLFVQFIENTAQKKSVNETVYHQKRVVTFGATVWVKSNK